MLWYKAWLETRGRFLVSLVSLTLFCGLFVHHALDMIRPEWKVAFNRLLFVTQEFLALMWILSAILLGMGGVVYEKAVGTAALSLSLPVSRARLQLSRVAVGALEAVALGVIPWLTILTISWRAKMPVQTAQVGVYVLLLIAGGLVYYAMAVLVSSLVEGAYSAPAVAIGLVFLSTIVLESWFRQLNLWRFVTGGFHLDTSTFLLARHFPWVATLCCLGTTVLILLGATMAVLRHDF